MIRSLALARSTSKKCHFNRRIHNCCVQADTTCEDAVQSRALIYVSSHHRCKHSFTLPLFSLKRTVSKEAFQLQILVLKTQDSQKYALSQTASKMHKQKAPAPLRELGATLRFERDAIHQQQLGQAHSEKVLHHC
jgi:hypothetical protein